jgi:hypothetical protein
MPETLKLDHQGNIEVLMMPWPCRSTTALKWASKGYHKVVLEVVVVQKVILVERLDVRYAVGLYLLAYFCC